MAEAEAVVTAVAVVEQKGNALAAPLPAFSGVAMAQALVAYKDLQRALDEAMPDQLMSIGFGDAAKKFRKKGYWRAVAVAFNLTVEPTDERREANETFDDGRPNFGYVVTYRASAPNGRTAFGDGSCFAIEKASKFRCPHPERADQPGGRRLHFPPESCPDFDPASAWRRLPDQATEHNIRSHAHTRAFNRAVSNLVGFGEVSAEEVDRDAHDGSAAPVTSSAGSKSSGGSKSSTAAPAAKVAQPADQHPDREYVREVKVLKTGKGAKGPWTLRRIVTVRNGKTREATTFSDSHVEAAERAMKDGLPVEFVIVEKGEFKGQKQYEVQSIEPVFYADEVDDSDAGEVLEFEDVDGEAIAD